MVDTLLLYVDNAQVFLPYRLIYSVRSSFRVLHCGMTKVPITGQGISHGPAFAVHGEGVHLAAAPDQAFPVVLFPEEIHESAHGSHCLRPEGIGIAVPGLQQDAERFTVLFRADLLKGLESRRDTGKTIFPPLLAQIQQGTGRLSHFDELTGDRVVTEGFRPDPRTGSDIRGIAGLFRKEKCQKGYSEASGGEGCTPGLPFTE